MNETKSSLASLIDSTILSLFPHVSTHLKHTSDQTLSTQLFPHENLVAALAISFNRYTIKSPSGESRLVRAFWSGFLGYLAWKNYDYWILISVHLISFARYVYQLLEARTKGGKSKLNEIQYSQVASALISFYSLIIYIVYSIANPESKYSLTQSKVYELITYTQETQLFNSVLTNASNLIDSFIPVSEIKSAYDLLIEFVRPEILNKKIQYLLFITFHIQTAMGFLGIEFLRNEQSRKNALIKIEDELKKHKEETTKAKTGPKMQNGKSKSTPVPNNSTEQEIDLSKKFRSSAAPFIIFIALPYMAQIVFYGAVNMFALHCFRDDIHRTIRLNDLFDNGGHRFVATSNASTLSPGAYATNSETVVSNVYDLFNKNLFSLPKLMLLPQIIAKQPMLLIKITPLILLSDYVKSVIVATITTETERISKQMKEMEAARNKIEEYDLKNSELIQRSGYDSIAFTEGRWVDLTESIQELKATSSLMTRSKMYFQWLQRHFVMMALVDCALARLIAVGKIVSADIFVYARAIEDFIGFIFMRSRAESELASMVTSIKVLKELKQIWNESADRNLLNCNVDEDGGFEMQDLAYSRGSAFVNITDISLPNGIYALTGANGSGKSTLFRLIMACDSNRKSIDMDSSIIIKTPGFVNMPSNNVVEISQNFYWPLNTAPIEWIYHKKLSNFNTDDKEQMINNLVKELQSLKLYPDTQPGSDLRNDLISTKDDWFSDLSGGQKSKVELVRKVFLEEECPKVLLIDETFAPLDPDSKSLVMQNLKEFCTDSVVIVIYHFDADVNNSKDGSQSANDACVPSSNFFDANLHVQDGSLDLRAVCETN